MDQNTRVPAARYWLTLLPHGTLVPSIKAMRIIAWNIRAGGGIRIDGIQAQLERWQPDIVCLCEYRATPPSQRLASQLAEFGLCYQESTATSAAPARNALLLASRWPLRRVAIRNAPAEPGRWFAARVEADQPFVLGQMHLPNMVTGRKLEFMASLQAVASNWRRGPAVLIGDTNCGWPGIDEERPVFGVETRNWLDSLARLGWLDAFRYLKGDERFYTWYSPNGGNGFRLDQAFVNRPMIGRLSDTSYVWGRPAEEENPRREALSDHAAIILDIA